MGLKNEQIRSIQQEIIPHFIDRALLYRGIEHGPLLEGSIDLQFSSPCARCIRIAVGDFAGLVVQALIAQHKKMSPRRRREVLEEALQFSRRLIEWPIIRRWLAIAMRISLEETALLSSAARACFLEEVEGFRAEWVVEANRKIDLRCLLTASPTRPTNPHGQLKVILGREMQDNAQSSHREICGIVDQLYAKMEKPIPIPRSWSRPGVTGMVSAYDNEELNPRVRAYLSKIKGHGRI